jgi:hypothetical protein
VSIRDEHDPHYQEDIKILHSMGYAQELSRRMGGFQNFAISFSIICILAGGITAFPLSLSAAGGASLGIGWPIASAFALIVAISLAQVASARRRHLSLVFNFGRARLGMGGSLVQSLGPPVRCIVSEFRRLSPLPRSIRRKCAGDRCIGLGLVDPDAVHHSYYHHPSFVQPLRYPYNHYPDRF